MNHLQDKHILLTRTEAQNKTTAKLVSKVGAMPVLFPCASIQILTENIQHAWQILSQLPTKNTDIIFSSRNGVEAVAQTVPKLAETLAKYRVIAVGEKTAQSLQERDIQPNWQPQIASQQGLIQDYPSHELPKYILFFRAKAGSDDLLNFLEQHGVHTKLCLAYDTLIQTEAQPQVLQQLKQGHIDAVLLGSARTAEFYAKKIQSTPNKARPVVAVMSQQVRKAADKLGLNVQVVASEPSFHAMLQGLNDYFEQHDKG
ncbi:MAG: uroporphyrinogen-III synthase [Ghiorsea sp.]|nr:uroporphyrinogen-III synthase [Ghiorsea sp.]